MPASERERLGKLGRAHVEKNYNFADFNKSWVELIDRVIEERGSYDTRKMYDRWLFKEIA